MTPSEYAAKFLNLNLFLPKPRDDDDPPPATSMYLPDPKAPRLVAGDSLDPGIWRRVKVNLYRLNGSAQAGILYSTLRNKVAFINVRVMRIDGSIQTHRFHPDEIRYALSAPFFGKGYPEECQVVLQLWDRYCSKRLDITSLVSTAGIGLDCSGFVGGYIDRLKAPANWQRKSETHTGDLIDSLLGRNYLKSWDMIQPPGAQCLLFGECDANGNVMDHTADGGVGHIMITEPGTLAKISATGPVSVDVVESTGPVGKVGLQRSKCTILSMPKPGVFYIQRGVPSKKDTAQEFMHVRIVQLQDRRP
jgi:hypothetical protein